VIRACKLEASYAHLQRIRRVCHPPSNGLCTHSVEVTDIAAAAEATPQQTDPQLSPLLRRNDYRKLTRDFSFAVYETRGGNNSYI
jgi:hypothetical protein